MKAKPIPSCKAKALAFLSRREHSKTELESKLSKAGYELQEIHLTLAWLEQNNWQSNERFAQSLARRRSANYGKRYISAELKQHAITASSSCQAIDHLPSEQSRAFAWLLKRSPKKPHEPADGPTAEQSNQSMLLHRAKMFRSLIARGFEPDDIKQAIAQWEAL